MYNRAAAAVSKYLKKGPWYIEANMHSGQPTNFDFNSLQVCTRIARILISENPRFLLPC